MAGIAGGSDSYDGIRHVLREELQHFSETVLKAELAALRESLSAQIESAEPIFTSETTLKGRAVSQHLDGHRSNSTASYNFTLPLQRMKSTGLSMLFSPHRRSAHTPGIVKDRTDQGANRKSYMPSASYAKHVMKTVGNATFGTSKFFSEKAWNQDDDDDDGTSPVDPSYVPMRVKREEKEESHEKRVSSTSSKRLSEGMEFDRLRSLMSEIDVAPQTTQTHIPLSRADRGEPREDSEEMFHGRESVTDGLSRHVEHNCARAFLLTGLVYPLTGVMIIINAISIGLETDYMAKNWTEHVPRAYMICDIVFLVYFAVEIALRIYAYRGVFFTGRTSMSNMFDLGLVILQFMEVTMGSVLKHWTKVASQIMICRIMRTFRILRVFRLFRILNLCARLRMLVIAVQDSMRSLVWSVVFIFLMIYTLGILLTQVVTNYKIGHDGGGDIHQLEEFYGSVENSVLSLYEAISDGVHWRDLMEPLRQNCSPWMAVFFSLYIAFALFAMLNVITGFFVEGAMEAARQDKRQILMTRMVALFLEADDDGSGTVDEEEFRRHLGDNQMEHILKEVELNPQEAMDLFYILDTKGEGEIQAEAFVNGCLRLNGSAKAIDLAAFMHEFKLFQASWHDQSEFQREAVRKIFKEMQLLSAKLSRARTHPSFETQRHASA